MPGMTEEYRLPVFIKQFMASEIIGSDLKVIYVCEGKNEQISKKLTELTDNIFEDLIAENLVQFLIKSENSMYQEFSKYKHLFKVKQFHIDLPDTKCVIIANHSLD